MHIYRELHSYLYDKISISKFSGFIISGIVGCGKTTMINALLESLKNEYKIFKFSGDDIQFRNTILNDTKYIAQQILSTTQTKSIVFVDEVQKSEHIFDALKYAYDAHKISFIVSGSNPAYLASVAKKRLQRRAEHLYMLPFSLPEILLANNLIPKSDMSLFYKILWEVNDLKSVPATQFTKNDPMIQLISKYFTYGGLPLAHLASDPSQKLTEIKLTVERGFDLFSVENNDVAETIKIELAKLQSKEFTYKNIFAKTRTNRRDLVNNTINELINHDYLVRKRPQLLKTHKSSYLNVFSFIDPGIVTYLTADFGENAEQGFRIEGYIHARLDHFIKNAPLKCTLGYYKPHSIDKNNKTKYAPGEIDFIFQMGKRILPIEVKATSDISQIDLTQIKYFLKEHKNAPFAIVLYGGVPFVDPKAKILFWPHWLV